MRMTLDQFTSGMELLAAVYGNDHVVFKNPDIAEIWFEFFATRYSNDKFRQMIKHYLGMSHWFPRVPNDICKLWEESGDERRPGEDWRSLQEQTVAALPSSEAREKLNQLQEIEKLSPEQMAENKRKLDLLLLIAKNMQSLKVEDREEKIKHLSTAPVHELEAIARTCQKAKKLVAMKADVYGNLKVSNNVLFEDMYKYFHSGSERCRQAAIDWASNPANGCELVKVDGQVTDIKQIDF